MSWKPNETDIVDYLYGELSADKQQQFEKFLKQNNDFAKEVTALRLTQGILPSLPDEEVIPPMPFATVPGIRVTSSSTRKWLYPVSIAASIAALILIGYFTQFSLSIGGEGFKITFNDNVPSTIESLNEDEINALIERRVNMVANQWNNELTEVKVGFANQLEQNKRLTKAEIRRVVDSKVNPEIDETHILAFISQLKEENKKMMLTFYQASAEEQQQYMRNVLLEFNDYLDNQRQEDLQFIQANLLDLKNTSELKQEETDKILATIITTVNNQNSLGQ